MLINKPLREQAKVIEKYLKAKFKEIKYENDTYYITSKDASKITNTIHEEKIKAVSQIKDLLIASNLIRMDEKPNHKLFSIFFYFETIFEIDNNYYKGELNIGYHKYLS